MHEINRQMLHGHLNEVWYRSIYQFYTEYS